MLYDLVVDVCQIEGDLLEIGSAWGRSTVLLALASKRTVWSIDPHTGGSAYVQRGQKQDSYEEFIRNLEKHGVRDKVIVLRHTTEEVLIRQIVPSNVKFAFCFIDGMHTPKAVGIDFNFAYPRLVPRGIMVFDDYFEPSVRDYAKTIERLAEETGEELYKDLDSKLVWIRKYTV